VAVKATGSKSMTRQSILKKCYEFIFYFMFG
jgi:hypothetical protein